MCVRERKRENERECNVCKREEERVCVFVSDYEREIIRVRENGSECTCER